MFYAVERNFDRVQKSLSLALEEDARISRTRIQASIMQQMALQYFVWCKNYNCLNLNVHFSKWASNFDVVI